MDGKTHSLKTEGDLHQKHPILPDISQDMAELQVMYEQLWNALNEQVHFDFKKIHYFLKIFKALRKNMERLRVTLTLPGLSEYELLMKYLSVSTTIASIYRGYVNFTYKEALARERQRSADTEAAASSGPSATTNIYAELLPTKDVKLQQAKEYIRISIIDSDEELETRQILEKVLSWHDTLVEDTFPTDTVTATVTH